MKIIVEKKKIAIVKNTIAIRIAGKVSRYIDASMNRATPNASYVYSMCTMCTECVHLLLAHSAPVRVKNAQGWTPLAEAISYGDRQTGQC